MAKPRRLVGVDFQKAPGKERFYPFSGFAGLVQVAAADSGHIRQVDNACGVCID